MRGLTKKQARLVILVAAAKRLPINVNYDTDSLITSYRVGADYNTLLTIATAIGT